MDTKISEVLIQCNRFRLCISSSMSSCVRNNHSFVIVIKVFFVEWIRFICFISVCLDLWKWFACWTGFNDVMISNFHNRTGSCLLLCFVNERRQLLFVSFKSTSISLIHLCHSFVPRLFLIINVLANLTCGSRLISNRTFLKIWYCLRET